MSELKPCPFCGGEAKFVHIFENPDKCMVSCRECDGGIDAVFANEEKAIAAWNRRAQPVNDLLTLEQLREMDGDPVWIEHITMQKYSHWYIWSNAPVDDTHDGFDGYGKTWLAYRRKPERSENDG